MPISHAKSVTGADYTGTVTVFNSQGSTTTIAATDLVRGQADWNSAHNMTVNYGGNTYGTSQLSGSDVQWYAGPGIGFSNGGSTATVYQYHQSVYEPVPIYGQSTASQSIARATASENIYFFPFQVPVNLTVGAMNLMFSASFLTVGTSSGRQSGGLWAGLYTRGTGGNSTTMQVIESTSFSWAVTGNNSSYTISQPTASNFASYTYSTTASAGSNISSQYTGLKLVAFPYSTSLSAGRYYLALLGTNSTSSVNVGLSMFVVGGVASGAFNIAPLGSLSSSFSIGTNHFADWYEGMGSMSTVGSFSSLPGTVTLANITEGITVIPFMKFWST